MLMKQLHFLKKSVWLAAAVFLSATFSAQAQQASCPNLDFSFWNFQNWICQTANSASTSNTDYTALTWTGLTAVTGRHTIMNDIFGEDANTCDGVPNPKLALVPDGFNQSARIGDANIGANAECIKYTMAIDTNNALLLVHFAYVIENPQHADSVQPRFEVRLQDTNGNLLAQIPAYFFSSSEDSGYYKCNSMVQWRDWTTYALDLRPMKGRKVQLVFFSADCSLTGHYGYGYGVAEARQMNADIQYCEGSDSAVLTAPAGLASYVWKDPAGKVVGKARRIKLPAPDAGYYICEMKSVFGVLTTLKSEAVGRTKIHPDCRCELDTCARRVRLIQKVHAEGAEISGWTWEIGKKGGETEFFSSDSVVEYVLKDTGLYEILLTANTSNGCSKDTLFAVMNSQSLELPEAAFTCDRDTCAHKLHLSLNTAAVGPNASGWMWTVGKPGVAAYTGTDTVVDYTFRDSGSYDVVLSVYYRNACPKEARLSVTDFPALELSGLKASCSMDTCAHKLHLSLDRKAPALSHWIWHIGKKGQASEYASKKESEEYVLKDTGLYEVRLTAYTGYGCSVDTVFSINVPFRKIQVPEFRYSLDTCLHKVQLSLRPEAMDPNMRDWYWRIEKKDGSLVHSSQDTLDAYILEDAGEYRVTLTAYALNGCPEDTLFSLVADPTVNMENLQYSCSFDACLHGVEMSLGRPADDTVLASWTWNVEKRGGETEYASRKDTLSYLFKDTGCYDVKLTAYAKNGCPSDTVFSILNPPFTKLLVPQINPVLDTCIHKVRLLMQPSRSDSNISRWMWKIGKDGAGLEHADNDSVAEYVFKDTGKYTVSLVVYSQKACPDSIEVMVYNFPDPPVKIYAPLEMCKYENTRLFANGAVNFFWSSLDSGKIVETDNDSIYVDRGGTYSVIGYDEHQCPGWDTVNVEHKALRTTFNVVDEPCYNDAKGSIAIRKTEGGIIPYRYTWQGYGTPDMAEKTANQVMQNLPKGTYYLFTIDGIGCVKYDTVEITEPDSLAVVLDSVVFARCDMPNGSIDISVEGGSVPYTYLWDTPAADTTQDVRNLAHGSYMVRVTDRNNCTKSSRFVLERIPVPKIEVDTLLDETCDASNGLIDVRTINGVEPLEYKWSPDATGNKTDRLQGIPAGMYHVQVTDGYGCVYDTLLQIVNHPAPEITVAALTPEYCSRADGTVRMEVKGTPVTAYRYSWLPTEVDTNSPEIRNLKAGRYTLTVADGNCKVSKEVKVDSVPGPQADFVLSADSVAENETLTLIDRSASSMDIGMLLSWTWNFGDGTSDSGRVVTHSYSGKGDYTISLTVTDDNRCMDTADKRLRVYHVSGVAVEDYDEEGAYRMFIPNAFTPNGDGLNDGWGPSLQEYLEDGYLLSVYDSQGRLVWRSSDPSARWDGTVSGKPVRGGSVFAYRLQVRDYSGKLHAYAGHVTVIK